MNPTAPAACAAPAPCPARRRVVPWAAALRRTLAVALIAIVAAGAAPARAGEPASDGRNVMRLEAAVSPALAGGIRKPRAIALRFSATYRALAGGAGDPFYRQIVATPDMVVFDRGRDIPQCSYSDFGLRGEDACPKGSRVGTGVAVFDGRSASLPEELPVRLRLYNATADVDLPPGVRPAPVIVAVPMGGALKGHLLVAVPHLRCCAFFSITGGVHFAPALPLTELRLSIRRIVGRGGRPYLAAPTSCRGSWQFRFRTTFVSSGIRTLSALDDVPCRRR